MEVKMELTELETKILNNLGDNEYIHSPDEVSWAFCALEGINPKRGRGAISSLIKKGIIEVQESGGGEEDIAWLTAEGVKLFNSLIKVTI